MYYIGKSRLLSILWWELTVACIITIVVKFIRKWFEVLVCLLQKDPYAPKRPKSGYLHYLDAFRAKHPELGHKDIVSKGAESWGKLSEKEKVPYNTLYEKAKEEYNAKLQAMVSVIVSPCGET